MSCPNCSNKISFLQVLFHSSLKPVTCKSCSQRLAYDHTSWLLAIGPVLISAPLLVFFNLSVSSLVFFFLAIIWFIVMLFNIKLVKIDK